MARWRGALAAMVVASGTGGAIGVAGPGSAHAAGGHRALVVVETGAATYRKVITFAGDSVTGIQALQLAGADPVVYSFAGQGGAVCRLFGVGRDAGPDCLGGTDGDNRYWAYFRAPSGTSMFSYSRSGAGSVQVHDGDVEGWKFGTGQAPAWVALPTEPTTTTTTAPGSPPTSPPAGSGGAGIPPTAGASSSTPPPGATQEQVAAFYAALGTATSTTTTIPAAGTAVRANHATRGSSRRVGSGSGAAGPLDSGPRDSGGDGGSAGSLAIFGAVAIALVGGGVLLRRSRRRPIP